MGRDLQAFYTGAICLFCEWLRQFVAALLLKDPKWLP